MKNLRTLAWLTGAAIIVAAFYAGALRDRTVDIDFDADDSRTVAFVREGDQGAFRYRGDALEVEAEWRGDFTLNAEGDDVASLDGKLWIALERDARSEKAIFEPRRDGVRRRYFRDGEEAEGAEAEAGAAAAFATFMRVSGVQADQRVRAILDSAGAGAALAEIAALESDLAVRRYVLALNDLHELSGADIAALSDILRRMENDQDLRLTLSGLLETDGIGAPAVRSLLEAARGMESAHDIRKLIESAAAGPLDDAGMAQVIRLYGRIDGDHDLRKAAEALLESGALTPDQRALALAAAAGRIDGDRDMRVLLETAAPDLPASGALVDAWFDGFAGIDTSRDQRLALEAIANGAAASPALAAAYRKAAAAIDDRRDREGALDALDLAAAERRAG